MKAMIIIYISLFGFIFSQSFPFSGRYLAGVSGILQKGQTQTKAAYEEFFIFNSGDFKDGEEMYFKIKAEHFLHYHVYYEFSDPDHSPIYIFNQIYRESFNLNSHTETIGSKSYSVQYFTIKKDKSKFKGTKGDWLYIYFLVDGNHDEIENEAGDGNVILENTLEDEGKFETWKIVVIVVAIVLVIGLAIGCYCYRRKKQLAMMNQNAGGGYPGQTVGVNQYNNNAQYNPQYDPNQQYMQPGSNYDVNQQYNQPPANYDPNQQYNQPVDNYGQQY